MKCSNSLAYSFVLPYAGFPLTWKSQGEKLWSREKSGNFIFLLKLRDLFLNADFHENLLLFLSIIENVCNCCIYPILTYTCDFSRNCSFCIIFKCYIYSSIKVNTHIIEDIRNECHWDLSNMCTYDIDVQSVADKMVREIYFRSQGKGRELFFKFLVGTVVTLYSGTLVILCLHYVSGNTRQLYGYYG